MIALTSTTFSGGVDEKLAAIDIYAQSGELFSGIEELLNTQNNAGSLSESVSSTVLSAPSLTSMTMLNNDGELAIDPSAVMSNASAVVSEAYSAIQSAPGALKQALSAVNQATTNITTSVAGVTSTIRQASTGNVTALFNATKGLIDPSINAQMKDIASLTTVASNVVKQATTTGLGGAFTAISQSTQYQGSALQDITKSVLPVIGAVGNIKAFIEVASQKGPAMLSAAIAPNIGIDVLASFNATKNGVAKTQVAMVNQWGQFKTSATSIQNNFFTAQKNAKTLLSSKGLQKLSSDSALMLKSSVNQATTQASSKMAQMTPAQLVSAIKLPPFPTMEQTILPTLIKQPTLTISTPVDTLYA